MARYIVKKRKTKRSKRRGLGYVYYTVPAGSSQLKTESLTTGTMQSMSDIYGKYLTDNLLATNPTKYAEYLKKRDDGVVKILDIWKVPYTRDDSFGSNIVGLTKDQILNISSPQSETIVDSPINENVIVDLPLSQTVIVDENNNEVPIETVLGDPNAEVILTGEEVETNNTLMYVGAAALLLGVAYLAFKK